MKKKKKEGGREASKLFPKLSVETVEQTVTFLVAERRANSNYPKIITTRRGSPTNLAKVHVSSCVYFSHVLFVSFFGDILVVFVRFCRILREKVSIFDARP